VEVLVAMFHLETVEAVVALEIQEQEVLVYIQDLLI
jgi:hypothetical protein